MTHKIFATLMGLALAACSTPANTDAASGAAPKPPAQIAAQVCTPLEVAVAGLQADVGLPQGALHDLALAAPQVESLCASAALANAGDAAALENLAFNVVLPIAQAQNPKLAADLLALQILLSVAQAVQVEQPAAVATPATK
jgi:hypothetical protein